MRQKYFLRDPSVLMQLSEERSLYAFVPCLLPKRLPCICSAVGLLTALASTNGHCKIFFVTAIFSVTCMSTPFSYGVWAVSRILLNRSMHMYKYSQILNSLEALKQVNSVSLFFITTVSRELARVFYSSGVSTCL